MLDKNDKLINSEVRIENTTICQAICKACPREKFTRKHMTMPYDHFVDLVCQAELLGAKAITIFGYGEPLLDKTIVEKVQFCTGRGLDTFITTNVDRLGIATSFKLLQAGLKHIRFSIHGITPDNYEAAQPGLKHSIMMQNISNFLAINKAKFDGTCKTSVSFIPMHGETVEEIRDTWEAHVDWLEIWRPHNWTDGRDYRKVERRMKTCGRPINGPVQINSNGTIMVCCFDYNGKMILGDTYKDSIKDILKSPMALHIKTAHQIGSIESLPCEYCDQLNEYSEEDYPLLYSNRDPNKEIGVTSSCKTRVLN